MLMPKPNDLGVKIGTKREKAFTSVRDKAREAMEQAELELELNTLIKDYAEEQIHKEKK